MRWLTWALRLFLFFTLFAFALNNNHDVVVHWFFGYQWRAPLVIVVLLAFALGTAVGTLAMVPAWWQRRRQALRRTSLQAASAGADGTPNSDAASPASALAGAPGGAAPALPIIRDGL